MRPTLETLGRSAPLAMACWLVTWISAAPLPAQAPPANYPSAIISSGGAAPAQEPPALPQRSLATPSAWTSDGNQSSGGLRSHASQADTQLPVTNSAVITAAAQAEKHIPLAPPSQRFTGETPKQSSSTLQTVVSVGSSLLLVVGLFLGVAWCYRKTLSSSVSGGLPKQVVHVLGRTSISTRQQMVLVHFGSKLLLVSIIQGEARTLSEISDPLEVDQLVGLCESGQPTSISNSFKSILLQEGGR